MARIVPKEELDARRPPPPAHRPEPAIDINALAQVLAQAVREIKIPSPTIAVSPADVVVSPSMPEDRPTQWRFTVKRDKQGFISEIIADATT